jgi:F-type H+-transporting ATPase subunit b
MSSNFSVVNSLVSVSAISLSAIGRTVRNCVSFSAFCALAFAALTISVSSARLMGEEEVKPAASETKAEGDKAHSDSHGEGDSHAAGHGHDDLDNTHKDGSKGLESPDTIAADKTLFSVVVFILLLAGLYFLAWGPIMEGLAKREASINTLIANAEKSSADAASKLREYELKLEVAAQEAQSMLAQARKDAETAGQKIINEAQAEAARQKEQALADIDSAKRVALSELSSKSTELAFTLAKRIVGRELRTEDHQQLVADVLKQFPSHN